MFKRIFKAFEYRDFRLMWIGACTSSIGTWMQILAQSWLVYQISNNPQYLGIDQFLGQIPIFLFSLFGGVFADRKSRRGILLASQFIQMSCAFILTVLSATHVVRSGTSGVSPSSLGWRKPLVDPPIRRWSRRWWKGRTTERHRVEFDPV